MLGHYYRTLERDEATGDTDFLFAPTEPCPEARDGLLRCRGKIGIYARGVPLQVTGAWDGTAYGVTDARLSTDTREGSRQILDFLTDLTKTQMEQVLDACRGQVFSLLDEPGVLDGILKRSKDGKKKALLGKLRKLQTQEALSRKLMGYGVPLDRIEALLEDGVTEGQLKRNPYYSFLFHDISIHLADQMAYEESRIAPYDERRLLGFLADAMLCARAAGHTCQTLQEVCRTMNRRLKPSVYPDTRVGPALVSYLASLAPKQFGFHVVGGNLYLYETPVWEEETRLIQAIGKLTRSGKAFLQNVQVNTIEETLGITYNPEQREAFALLRTGGIKILTGPPGSGKTAMIRGLLEAVKTAAPEKRIRLSATTGRASQVLSASCGRPAETVHKLLGIRPFGESLWSRNESNPVNADFLIVDEVSMLGLKMASLLFRAVKPGSILLLVGDDNQLQSVEYGNILQDLMASGQVEVYRLSKVMRQSGRIYDNARKVLEGSGHLEEGADFQVHHCREEDVFPRLLGQIQKEDCRVISPVKGGPCGVRELNRRLQERADTGKLCLTYNRVSYHVGDPVLMNQTNYDKGYYNGDIGRIKGKDGKGLLVEFGDVVLHLDREDYHVMSLAYAITAHKVQGSEFGHIHIVLPRQPEQMLTRRILYTAITRAKQDVHLYEVDGACGFAISNQAERPRRTLLAARIREVAGF